jgi:hypothetical protein
MRNHVSLKVKFDKCWTIIVGGPRRLRQHKREYPS